jgi:hypothetical protein
MIRADILKFNKKSIKVFLRNHFVYSGTLLDTSEQSITLIDKFGKQVLISLDDITSVTEGL